MAGTKPGSARSPRCSRGLPHQTHRRDARSGHRSPQAAPYSPPVNVTRISWQRDLVTAALPGQQLHETPVATQIHIGEIFTLDRALTDHAFTRTHTSTATTWENAAGQTLTLEHATLHLTTTTLPHNITNLACMKSCMQESKQERRKVQCPTPQLHCSTPLPARKEP